MLQFVYYPLLNRVVTIITKDTMIKTDTTIIAIVIFFICVLICLILFVICADRVFIVFMFLCAKLDFVMSDSARFCNNLLLNCNILCEDDKNIEICWLMC